MTDRLALAEQIERLRFPIANKLDVQCEIALFKPGSCYAAVRANEAGTKVIYTDHTGNEVTCWAQDWTLPERRQSTIAALRAGATNAKG